MSYRIRLFIIIILLLKKLIGYKCEFGSISKKDICSPICGDGRKIIAKEDCDDGNIKPGDGCSGSC